MALLDVAHSLQEKYNNHAGGMDPEFGGFVSLALPYANIPDGSQHQPTIDALKDAMDCLTTGDLAVDPVSDEHFFNKNILPRLNEITGELTEWTGSAAETFRDHVQVPFPGICQNMFVTIGALRGAAMASRDLWQAVDHDINEIFNKADESIDALGDPTGGATLSLLLVAAAAVVTVVAAPAGVATTAALVAGGLSTAAEVPPVTADVECACDLYDKTKLAVDSLTQRITDDETRIKNALVAVAGWPKADDPGFDFVNDIDLRRGPGGIGGRR